jgi:hypothetical protein
MLRIFGFRHSICSASRLPLAAVRGVAYEAADTSLLSPGLAAGIRRVKGVKTRVCGDGVCGQGRNSQVTSGHCAESAGLLPVDHPALHDKADAL